MGLSALILAKRVGREVHGVHTALGSRAGWRDWSAVFHCLDGHCRNTTTKRKMANPPVIAVSQGVVGQAEAATMPKMTTVINPVIVRTSGPIFIARLRWFFQ